MKILIVNDYLEGRQHVVDAGLYPRHHLWGADALEQAGHQITYLEKRDSARSRLMIRVQRLARGRLGELELEDRVRRSSRDHDVIYSCGGHLRWLPSLRHRGRFAKPIVGWTFMPPGPCANRGFRFLETLPSVYLGHDLLLSLTPRTRDEFRQLYPGIRTEYVAWGADPVLFTPAKRKPPGDYILSCGRTQRDFGTLLEASRLADTVPILLLSPGAVTAAMPWPSNVRVVQGPSDGGATDKGIPYPELAENLMGNARAVVISLTSPNTTAGYTNLIEAISMRLPVVMTDNSYLDPDLIRRFVRWTVPVGDAAALATALKDAWVQSDVVRTENPPEPTYDLFCRDLLDTLAQSGIVPPTKAT